MRELQQLIGSVLPSISKVDTQLQKLADTHTHIRSRARDVTGHINCHMDTYLSAVQQHRKQLLLQVDQAVGEKQHALHVTERHLRHVRADVQHTCTFVSDMIENASDVEILSVKRLVTDRLTSLKDLTDVKQRPVGSFIQFCPASKGQVINNFQMFGRVVSRAVAVAASSVILSEGLSTSRVAHESSLILQVKCEDGSPYTDLDLNVKAWVIIQNSQPIRSLPVKISAQQKGSYLLKFTPTQQGAHLLHVAVDGQPIKDSPCKFRVKGQWRQHKGAWHCCSVCSSGGHADSSCACMANTPGAGGRCSHGQPGHPGGHHWSCCGKWCVSQCAPASLATDCLPSDKSPSDLASSGAKTALVYV